MFVWYSFEDLIFIASVVVQRILTIMINNDSIDSVVYLLQNPKNFINLNKVNILTLEICSSSLLTKNTNYKKNSILCTKKGQTLLNKIRQNC